jgi:hypothetical protein
MDRGTKAALGHPEKDGLSIDQALGIDWADQGRLEKAAKTTEYQQAET